jgi:hypothetical protein
MNSLAPGAVATYENGTMDLRKARWKGAHARCHLGPMELGGSHSMSSWTLDNRVSGGRVVRIFVHRRGELVDQWFIVAIDDDEEAKVAIAKLQAM